MKQFLCAVSFLLLAGCSYITGGEGDTPDLIEQSDVQGCYYDAYRSSFFYEETHYENGSEILDSLHNSVYCRKVCVEGTKATDLSYERRTYWSLDTLQQLSYSFTDSSLAKGSANVVRYNKDDGHFYKNLWMKFKYDDYSDSHRYIFEERDGVKSIYHHGAVVLSSVEDEACAE